MLKICERHSQSVVYSIESPLVDCPVCHLNYLLNDNEDQIKELKGEVHRQVEELGRSVLVSVINQELLEVCKIFSKAFHNYEMDVDVSAPYRHIEMIKRANEVIAHADHPDLEKKIGEAEYREER